MWNSVQGLRVTGYNSRSVLQTGRQVEKLITASPWNRHEHSLVPHSFSGISEDVV